MKLSEVITRLETDLIVCERYIDHFKTGTTSYDKELYNYYLGRWGATHDLLEHLKREQDDMKMNNNVQGGNERDVR